MSKIYPVISSRFVLGRLVALPEPLSDCLNYKGYRVENPRFKGRIDDFLYYISVRLMVNPLVNLGRRYGLEDLNVRMAYRPDRLEDLNVRARYHKMICRLLIIRMHIIPLWY